MAAEPESLCKTSKKRYVPMKFKVLRNRVKVSSCHLSKITLNKNNKGEQILDSKPVHTEGDAIKDANRFIPEES